tara:strand:+ start:2404 stop:2802 length:399 start_codon:yes stop_codon:yes gene_type:complete
MKTKYKKTNEYIEKGVRYMQCQTGCCYISVADETKSVRCYYDLHHSLNKLFPNQDKPRVVRTGRPAGWHFMKEFVDKSGNVFHKGVEMVELKGTLPPTIIKPKKKAKRRTKEQILIARYEKKKAAIKKASAK